MKSIDQVVSNVDVFAHPLEINFEPDKKHGIYIPFVATLALVVIISVSTISSLVDLFNYKKVVMTGYREIFAQADPINATVPMIAIKIDELKFQDFSTLYDSQQPLQPCTHNHWKDISEEEFSKFKVSNYYCLKNTDGFSFQLFQLQGSKGEFNLILRRKSWPKNTTHVKIHMLLFNQKSVEKQKLAYQNTLEYFYRFAFFDNLSHLMDSPIIDFSYIVTKIKDDPSFFPFSSTINNTITTLNIPTTQKYQKIENTTQDIQYSVLWLRIQLSLRALEYERNVGKITDIFAEAGGLYTSVFGIFSIFVLIYYNHKLRLRLAECTFKKNSIKPSDYGFIKSLRYGTRGIVKPYENSELANDCRRIQQNLNEVDSLVHIEMILNRLQILENTLEQSQDKDNFACSRLFQKSSVKKIQRKRLSIEYLGYVVQGRNSITIKEARKMYNGLGMSLKDFFNRRLKHRRQLFMQNDKEKMKLDQALQTENYVVHSQIESSQKIQTQSFIPFKEKKSGLNTLQKVINEFRDIKAEAEQVEMVPELAKIEISLAKAFYKMKENLRSKKQQKIPIIILHRLMKTIWHLKMKKQERQQKYKQQDAKAENIQKSENKEEEEESSDSSDCFDEDD